jgi:hypothetical protein
MVGTDALPSCPAVSRRPGRIEEGTESFTVKDANGQQIAYIYFEDEPQRQMSMKRLSRDEAFLIAVNIAKLPSVPRQITKDIPRPSNSASRDDCASSLLSHAETGHIVRNVALDCTRRRDVGVTIGGIAVSALGQAAAVKSRRRLWIDLQRRGEVGDRIAVQAEFQIGEAAIAERFFISGL